MIAIQDCAVPIADLARVSRAGAAEAGPYLVTSLLPQPKLDLFVTRIPLSLQACVTREQSDTGIQSTELR